MFKHLGLDSISKYIFKRWWIVIIVITISVFFVYRDLFGSYFEADEWVHFTYYLPLTKSPIGFFTSIFSTIGGSSFLSGEGQHINPVATSIFFLNTKFFGLNFPPYAFMTLLFHSINTFLLFIFVRLMLNKKAILVRSCINK